MFGSKEKAPTATTTPTKVSSAATSLSVIGIGMSVRGDVETAGVVKVEGVVDGHVIAGSQVLVAKGGVVKGDIETNEAVIGGEVAGGVHASERVEIQAGATIQGDIATRRISVAEGATLNGHIRMGDVAEHGAKPRQPSGQVPSMNRPSVPVARVAVSPRSSSQGNNGH